MHYFDRFEKLYLPIRKRNCFERFHSDLYSNSLFIQLMALFYDTKWLLQRTPND